MSEALNIYQRLHAVMGEIDYIQKEKKQGMRYSIVSHDKVTAAVRPLLHKHGVVYYILGLDCTQDGNRTLAKICVKFTNIDEPNDYIVAESFGYGVDDQDKGPGKAMSYAVKYALLKTLGLETGDEPDEVQDSKANYVALPYEKEQADLGSIKGDGASRHASNPLFAHLQDEMKTKDNLDDLNLWWVESGPAVKRMNSEHQHFMFIEMMKRGFGIAPARPDLRNFLISHKTEMKSLEDRSKNQWEGLQDFYDLARQRLEEARTP